MEICFQRLAFYYMFFFILRKHGWSTCRSQPSCCRLMALVVAGAVSAIAGCGSSSGPQMMPIKGNITYNGQPLTQGRVVYMPKEPTAARQANGPTSIRMLLTKLGDLLQAGGGPSTP